MTKRVLIIDDDEDIQAVTRIALEKFAGWQAVQAGSGPAGLAIAQSQPLDAILLDVSMPDMDGLSVLAALQAHPTTQAIPVILLTAKVLPSDRRQFAHLSIAGMIAKPFNPLELHHQMIALLHW